MWTPSSLVNQPFGLVFVQVKFSILKSYWKIFKCILINFKNYWDGYFPLIEFAYNNTYHSSVDMAPFEDLYGRRCRSPIGGFEVGKFGLISTYMEHEAIDKVNL